MLDKIIYNIIALIVNHSKNPCKKKSSEEISLGNLFSGNKKT